MVLCLKIHCFLTDKSSKSTIFYRTLSDNRRIRNLNLEFLLEPVHLGKGCDPLQTSTIESYSKSYKKISINFNMYSTFSHKSQRNTINKKL